MEIKELGCSIPLRVKPSTTANDVVMMLQGTENLLYKNEFGENEEDDRILNDFHKEQIPKQLRDQREAEGKDDHTENSYFGLLAERDP